MISEKRLGLAFGLTWAVFMLFIGLAVMFLGIGAEWLAIISDLYIGYEPTAMGLVIGMIWGFVDGFIGAYIFAFIYNWLGEKK